MTKFCPYCGKQLNPRSKFCPQCGNAKPERQRQSGERVDAAADQPAVRQARPVADVAGHSAGDRTTFQRSGERTSTLNRPRSEARVRTLSVPARPNGAARSPARRYAPPTHALIGAFEQAGFGLRYGAWMFDFLITLIATMLFTFAVTAASRRSVVGSNSDLLIVAGLTLLLIVLNFVVLAGAGGQTAGMRILGVYIVRVDGTPFTLKHAAVRHLIGYPLSMAAFFLGFLWMLWDPRQQGWHDKLARTIVVMSK
ncbi:MAG TPA: RDD family protein [Blastocatellia bacterium]|nr:RDD family protein [Blastocatellia bacterium]